MVGMPALLQGLLRGTRWVAIGVAAGLALPAPSALSAQPPWPGGASTASPVQAQARGAQRPVSAKTATAGRKAAPAAAAANPYGQREDVLAFARDVAERQGLPLPWVAAHLAQAQRLPQVQRLIMPPPPVMKSLRR